MSHDRSTLSAVGAQDLTSHVSTERQVGNNGQEQEVGSDEELTVLEKWAAGRSETSFNTLAGAAGGFASGVITCPLDVIKTKLQGQGGFRKNRAGTSKELMYRGMVGTAKTIWRDEGVKGMYRGLGPIILGYLPTWAVWFTVYGRAKEIFSEHSDNPNIVSFWSSIVAGASSTMVTNPIWVIKTRLMLQVNATSSNHDARPPWHYRGTFDAARKMYKTEGILSFYSGLTPALLGLTHVAIQFPAYEFLKRHFTGQGMGGSKGDGDQSFHFAGTFAASILSKIVASSATYPHEVLRTRLQTQQRLVSSPDSMQTAMRNGFAQAETVPKYRGIMRTFNTILKEEGWRAFYAGMGTNMMRAVPAATTTIVTYEIVMKNLHHAKASGEHKLAEL